MELNLLPTIQQAISSLLLTYEPEFLRFGNRLFISLATIVIAWHGIQMMFSRDGLSDSLFEFAKLLLFDKWQDRHLPRAPTAAMVAQRKLLVRVMIVLERHAELLEIVDALASPRRLACRLNCRQQERDENTDDGNYHEQFH